jgi:UDP-glucose 4-epimerase
MLEIIMQDAQAAHGIEFVALRYFNAAGAYPEFNLGEFHVPETHLIPLALQAAYYGKPFSIFGTKLDTPDGSCVRDFVHVRDIADAHVRALAHLDGELPSDIFNLGMGCGYSVRMVLDMVQRVTGKKMVILEHQARAGDPSVLVADAGKARDVLGWEPRFSGLEFIVASAQVGFLRGMARVGSAERAACGVGCVLVEKVSV